MVEDLIAAKFAVYEQLSVVVGPCRAFSNPDAYHIRQSSTYVTSAASSLQHRRWPEDKWRVLSVLHPTSFLLLALAMATQVLNASVPNGAKANGKIKSKNQLRRLKAKQKKAEEKVTQVRPMRLPLA